MVKIYTRTGDSGQTGLFGGKRVSKDDPLVVAYGTIDEFNAALGVARAACDLDDVKDVLAKVQNELFHLGSDASTPEGAASSIPRVSQEQAAALEPIIDRFEAKLSPLTQFILPAGGELSARLHFARTICRRAERECVTAKVNPAIIVYLNRLGDLLFVLARYAAMRKGGKDEPWDSLSK